ncbi:MAG: nucleotidyl transferase AbiEii/AbiGii toxin family protein [Acidimicrobiia bacterium]
MTDRYATDDAFRTSLEQRLRDQARETGRPLDRLRKEVAHHRLLTRILESAPRGAWALKGGLALLARLDDRARATSDADANWRSTVDELEQTLDRSAALDLGDGFSFEIGAPRPLEGEGADGALRFPIRVVLAGREFERINLDVNMVPTDQRPTDEIQLRFSWASPTSPPRSCRRSPWLSSSQRSSTPTFARMATDRADHVIYTTCS